jgi:maleate cis-trans isomerase
MMYGYRARIAYTSPLACTEVFPYEFYGAVPKGVTLVLTTLAVNDVTADEVNRSYEISLRAAEDMASVGVDLVVLGGVPINLSRGFDGVDSLINDTQAKIGVPVTTSISAQLDALRTSGAKKVAIAHPFGEDDQQQLLVNVAQHYGFELTGIKGAGKGGRELGKIPLETSVGLCRELKRAHPESDTMWLPCPHWAVGEAIPAIEEELDVTVITANQATTWHALRRCGIADQDPKNGRLFAEH